MKINKNRIVLSIFTLVVSFLLFLDAFKLLNLKPDGEGTGVYLFGLFEMNDKVPYEQVSLYANVYIAVAVIVLMITLFVLFFDRIKMRLRQNA